MAQEIIDVHSHCFLGRSRTRWLGEGLARLRVEGLHRMVVVGLVNTSLDREAMWNLIPRSIAYEGDPRFFEAEDLLGFAEDHGPTLLPFVDTRHLWGDTASLLAGYVGRGFRGLKGIYLADERNDLGVASVPETFGISLAEYQRREWEIFAFAEARGLPLVYHMDARLYGDVMAALLDDFPRLRVDFAHLGIGRKAFSAVLDRYPNVYTDLASLLPHVQKNPASYRDFILHYSDRVCFGTDTNLYAPENTLDYIRMVREFDLPPEVEERVFSLNPRRFLGRALD
jgi:hypothetical protein